MNDVFNCFTYQYKRDKSSFLSFAIMSDNPLDAIVFILFPKKQLKALNKKAGRQYL